MTKPLGAQTLNRLVLAFKAFWRCLTQPDQAKQIASLLKAKPQGPDLRILAILQRDGRLVDFLMEEIAGYSDAQIGAAVRDIHKGCRKALLEYLALEAVLPGEEDARVTVAAGFDPAAVRLTGAPSGSPPHQGLLKHHGWKVRSAALPQIPGAEGECPILAPAEVEVSQPR